MRDGRPGSPGRRAGATTAVRAAGARQGADATRSRRREPSRAGSVRGRRHGRAKPPKVNHRRRGAFALVAILLALSAATVKLVMIQTVDASAYAAKAAAQRDRTIVLPATRGTIYDRNGTPLAFTVQGRAIAAWPALFTSDAERHAVADILGDELGPDVTAAKVFGQLTDGKSTYVYLARGLLPAKADQIMKRISDVVTGDRSPVTTERQDLRQYPDGTVTQSLLGATGWDGHGTGGIEIKFDSLLSGTDGSRTVDVDALGNAMPGTQRDEKDPVDGGDVHLTIDADLQYTVQQMLRDGVIASGAVGGSALVMSVKDAEVYAMASYYQGKKPAQVGNRAVTSPFEPGSVAKVITFGAALEKGLITPTTHFAVPGEIEMGGHVIHDAWPHSRVGMTATGILAKSSNVGTLMLAQQVGPDAFAAELTKYGLGQKSGIQLPADSAGLVPPQSQWSSTTFANLPIGQGLSMTLVQMAAMYQGIANGGVRIPPTIVAGTSKDGTVTAVPRGKPVRELSSKAAGTLLDMLRGTIQGGDIMHDGTAPSAAINGYQVAGKTGTAQQVDKACGCYSDTKVNATFAGIVPADHPQFVIAIMLDAPRPGSEGGTSAAPLFHDIAAYTMRAFDVPPSKSKAPIYDLYTNLGE
jgi:cell division protein FtsI (penicillin-binding protein 3)